MKVIFRYPINGEIHEHETDGALGSSLEAIFRREARGINSLWGHFASITIQMVEWSESNEIDELIETAKSRYQLFNMAGEHNELRMDRGEEIDKGAYKAMISCAQLVPDLIRLLEGKKR